VKSSIDRQYPLGHGQVSVWTKKERNWKVISTGEEDELGINFILYVRVPAFQLGINFILYFLSVS